jgi:c-di-GMP-related signal transduction protein
MEEIKAYRTSDGTIYSNKLEAEKRQLVLDSRLVFRIEHKRNIQGEHLQFSSDTKFIIVENYRNTHQAELAAEKYCYETFGKRVCESSLYGLVEKWVLTKLSTAPDLNPELIMTVLR